MFRSIMWYTKFVLALIGVSPCLLKANRLLKDKGQEAFDRYVYKVTSRWALGRVWDSGARIKIHGQERIPERNVLFVSNHQSDFDIAIFMSLVKKDTGFVAKVEMEKVPLLRTWMRNIHCVFLDRNNLRQSVKTIAEGVEILRAGYTLTVFPEGTRSKSDNIGEFKAGAFNLATRSGVPVVPVTIAGSYKIMEANNNRIVPADVDVFIHEPIETEGMSKDDIKALPERVKSIIADKITEINE